MDHPVNTCQIFDKPNDWITCNSCCKHIGIDVKGIEQTWISYTLVQICFKSPSLEALDLGFDSFIDLPRWRKTVKSKHLLKDRPTSKRQIEALGVLDVIVRKFDDIYTSHRDCKFQKQDFMNYFKPYFRMAILKSYIERCDESMVIRNILKVIRWTKVFQKVPTTHRKYQSFLTYFEKVAGALLLAMSRFCSEDSDLVIEFIKTMCLNRSCKRNFFNIFWNFDLLEFLMYHANARHFEFWGLYKKKCRLIGGPIQTFVDADRYDLMKIMMKYGYQYGYQRIDYLVFFAKIPNREVRPNAIKIMRKMKIKDVYPAFPILTVFRNRRRTKESVDMIRHLVNDVPTPYVTPDRLLAFSWKITMPEYNDKYVRACSDYANSDVYKEPYNVYRPRSLLHLCRVTIRQQLRKNHQLPAGVKTLVIPETLKKYLNLIQ